MELRHVEQEKLNKHVFSLYINKRVLNRRINGLQKILKPITIFIISILVGCGLGYIMNLIY